MNGQTLIALATATASAGQLRGGVRDGAGSDGQAHWLSPASGAPAAGGGGKAGAGRSAYGKELDYHS